MLEKGRISVRQLAVLLLLAEIGDMILVFPSVVTSFAHQDAWIYSFAGIPLGLLVVIIMVRLYKFRPQYTIIESLQDVIGKWLGSFIGLCYLLFYFISATVYVREVGDFITTQVLPQTPVRVINLLFVAILGWGLIHGLETIARSSEILMPVVILFLLLLILFLLPQANPAHLQPIMGINFFKGMQSMLVSVSYPFGELIVFLMILPYVKEQPHMLRDALLTTLIGGILLSVTVLMSILVIGPLLTEHSVYATFVLSQKIQIGEFLERIEAFMATAWVISTYVKCLLYYYAFTLATAQLFKLRDYRPFIMPFALLLYGMAFIISPNIKHYTTVVVPYINELDLTYGLVLPIMLLGVYWIKDRLNSADTLGSRQ
ncbi:spore gernimation protein [Paenibacillaceae bacterium]|nr:spore gernimation protein [Paenibacillaceae bacterium]